MGIIVASFAIYIGTIWQYNRMINMSRLLPGTVSVSQNVAGWHGGPLHWKHLIQSEKEVPNHVY